MKSNISVSRLIALGALLGLLGHALAGTLVRVDVNNVRPIPANFYGANGQSRNGFSWSETTDFPAAYAGMDYGVLRFPSGTGANYWDWSDGVYIGNYQDAGYAPDANNVSSTLTELQYEVDFIPGQKADYVINMLTNPQASGQATFSTDSPNLPYVQDMLSAMYSDGLLTDSAMGNAGNTVQTMELGNEYYWGFTDGADFPGYALVYPDAPLGTSTDGAGFAYGQLAATWINSIRNSAATDGFAAPKLGVVAKARGANGWSDPPRDQYWNQGLFAALTDGRATPDAVIFHLYQPSDLKPMTPVTDSNVSEMLVQPFVTWAAMTTDGGDIFTLDQSMPTDTSIWVTEYNISDSDDQIAHGTWAHGLYLAELSLLFLNSSQIQLALHEMLTLNADGCDIFHDSSGFIYNDTFSCSDGCLYWDPPSTPYTYTAQGLVFMELNRAASDQTQAGQLDFSDNSNISVTDGAVVTDGSFPKTYGWMFTDTDGAPIPAQMVILNLGSDSTYISLTGTTEGWLNITDGYYDQISGNPGAYVTGGTDGATDGEPGWLTDAESPLAATFGAPLTNYGNFELPPYSLTRIYYTP